jgi:diguanylate cyclase (GGDEF)-like protein
VIGHYRKIESSTINDIHRHTMGGELLSRAAEIINYNIGGSDFSERIGGDEFVVCLNNIGSVSEAVSTAQKLIKLFKICNQSVPEI